MASNYLHEKNHILSLGERPIDKKFLPHFGDALAVCFEVFGYRLDRSMTIHSFGRNFFGCDAAGIRKRYTGKTGISAVERSQIIVELDLAGEGLLPDDLALNGDDLRAKLIAQDAGIYGLGASTQFFRAISAFGGTRAVLSIVPEATRSPAFTQMEFDEDSRSITTLHPRDRIRFVSRAVRDARLILLDHAVNGADAAVLSPQGFGDWAHPAPSGNVVWPERSAPPLTVRALIGRRHVTALWSEQSFADRLDNVLGNLSHDTLKAAPEPPEFRILQPSMIRNLCEAMAQQNGPIRAACTVLYRIEPKD